MILLRCSVIRGVVKASRSSVFAKYSWSTYSPDFVTVASREHIKNLRCNKLICCEYSNKVSEDTVELLSTRSYVNEGSADATDAVFLEIADGDDQVLRKLKLLKFEIDVFKQTNGHVPDFIKKKDWEHLLTLNSINSRKKFLTFLFKNEKKEFNRKQKKKLVKEAFDELKEQNLIDSDPLSYSLSRQCLLLRIYNKTLNHAFQLRHELNEEIAQHVVFDCSYEEYMSPLNTKYCAMQLLYCLNLNMIHHYPCYVRLCNFNRKNELSKVLPKHILNLYEEDFMWPVHEESYLNFYPKDKLVYLTPHCNEPLHINPGDVYIIGAFVDKGVGIKASLARAKKHNLRMARFPLDEYLSWKQGTKSLPLNIVLNILLDMKLHNDWNIALQNIPRRHFESSDFDPEGLDDQNNNLIV